MRPSRTCSSWVSREEKVEYLGNEKYKFTQKVSVLTKKNIYFKLKPDREFIGSSHYKVQGFIFRDWNTTTRTLPLSFSQLFFPLCWLYILEGTQIVAAKWQTVDGGLHHSHLSHRAVKMSLLSSWSIKSLSIAIDSNHLELSTHSWTNHHNKEDETSWLVKLALHGSGNGAKHS